MRGFYHYEMPMTKLLAFALMTCLLVLTQGCATLPDTQFLTARYQKQAIQFQNARGLLSAKRSAAIVAELKRSSGNLDSLEKQIALEQEIIGNPLVIGNKVTLLQDGPATYRAMFSAISKAQDHIHVESFIIEDGTIGQQFADLLIERQSHGVQVHLLYDSIGSLGTPKAYFERLTGAGVKVLEFNPLNPLAVRKPWEINHRDHRKLLVVDGHTAILGGINISSVYASGSAHLNSAKRTPLTGDGEKGWRDTDIQIEGPVVRQFQALFIDTWNKQRGEPLSPKNYFPLVNAVGNEIVRAIGSTPDDPYSLMYLTLVAAITNAEQQVSLTNAYFVPDAQLLNALQDAAKRGVDVRILLPSQSDSQATFHAGRSYYATLLDSGVKIYERRGTILHSKTAIVDGVWSCVGSSNLDWRSALDNDEINAVILGPGFAQQMLAAFATDLRDAEQITRDNWERRSMLLRLKEATARLFGRLL